MNIILANYRYFVSGGPERYMFNVSNLLTASGHNVFPFSINYSQNEPSSFSKYFVGPLGGRDEIYFGHHKKRPATLARTITRLFYSPEVERAICRLVDETQPQIAYVLHYLRKLSPALLVGLKNKGLPVVVRLSDFAMLCPQAHCLRDNSPCTLCLKGNLLPSLKYKCLKGSFSVSLLNILATNYHAAKRYFDLIDMFVCTNQFMLKMMKEAGYPENRLICIPTFTDTKHFKPSDDNKKENYIAFSGRIDNSKGLHTLIDAFALLKKNKTNDIHLKIAGFGDDKIIAQYKQQVMAYGLDSNIVFLGKLGAEQLPQFLGKALFTVVPSLWFENLPNSIIESYACGTPVIASDIGSLSDCVDNYHTGLLFKPNNAEDLAEKMTYLINDHDVQLKMSLNARRVAEDKYSPDQHLSVLLRLFNSLV